MIADKYHLPLALALSLPAAWLLPRRLAPWGIAVSGAVFLGVLSPISLGVLTGTTLILYGLTRLRSASSRAPWGVLCVVLGFLLYRWFARPAAEGAKAIVLLGFSYYALRAVHYLLECYRERLPAHGLSELASYMFFPPALWVGPIHRFGPFVRELGRRRWNGERASEGAERILYGYTKVVVLAGYLLGRMGHAIAAIAPEREATRALLDCLRYGADLYLQFSGYCDVAIGGALLLGVRIEENFSFPFLSRNLTEFWERWHMSLSTFCRDYVYAPLAASTRAPLLAVAGAMLVLGLWHELSPRYVVWALYHALGLVAVHGARKALTALGYTPLTAGSWRVLSACVGCGLTNLFVILSFAITKEPTLAGALDVYRSLLTLRF